MIDSILDNNYLYIPNFIDLVRAKDLADEFYIYTEKNNSPGDKQVPNSSCESNFIDHLELLCEKTPEISKIIGETVLPTYTYARVYRHGAVLKKHTDREACEISVTLHLDGDEEWPIFIETPSGNAVSINLKVGGAMLYLGHTAPHWRTAFGGQKYTQVFLHYVRGRGDNARAFFDHNI